MCQVAPFSRRSGIPERDPGAGFRPSTEPNEPNRKIHVSPQYEAILGHAPGGELEDPEHRVTSG
jgi:hypothetical protein